MKKVLTKVNKADIVVKVVSEQQTRRQNLKSDNRKKKLKNC